MAEKKQDENFRHMVRVRQTDLDGRKQVKVALTKIKGIGVMFSNAICKIADIEPGKRTGDLEDATLKRIEDIIENPTKNNIPAWMLNRRKDYEEGVDKHILASDLEFTKSNDLRRLQKIKSYRGLRLSWGLTVRGQRTKAHFRKGTKKGLGVKRKK